MTKQNKTKEEVKVGSLEPAVENKNPIESKADISFSAIEKLLAKVEALEQKDLDNQKQLKMLTEVADKGRVMNYESKNAEKKPFKVKLSVYRDGIIVGWRVVKDELVKHSTTGLTIGEVQEFELLVLNKAGETIKVTVNGYPAFSDARYTERVECEVVSKKEDFTGVMTYDVKLPDGRVISLADRFLN